MFGAEYFFESAVFQTHRRSGGCAEAWEAALSGK